MLVSTQTAFCVTQIIELSKDFEKKNQTLESLPAVKSKDTKIFMTPLHLDYEIHFNSFFF